jgi:hypothetical protein
VNLNGSLDFLPTNITDEKQEKTAAWCFGLSWTHNDRVLCATRAGLEIRDHADLKLQKEHKADNHMYSQLLFVEANCSLRLCHLDLRNT